MPEETLRADVALCARGLAPSREKARRLIEAGLAHCDGEAIAKPSQRIAPEARLEVRGELCPYVSRGGLKLEKALRTFEVDPSGKTALDVGASTGGFTDALLQCGARRVYAVDVGTAQLDAKLAADPRVVSMEKVNARALTRSMFPEPPELGVMDVSFISITKILPALRETLGDSGRLIALIKPQFEAGRKALGKGGIVSAPAEHERVLREIVADAPMLGWRVRGLTYSPISGGDGNIEFLADLTPEDGMSASPGAEEIKAIVREAHAKLKATPHR